MNARQWLTGEPFVNLLGVSDQLNDYDSDYKTDSDQSCGKFSPSGNTPLQDESCNTRTKLRFLCEIVIALYIIM